MDIISPAVEDSSHADSLASCATEAIHLTQWVQSYGFVLVCDAATRLLERASQNTAQFLAIDPAAALGSPIAEWFEGGERAFSLAIQQVTPGTPQLVDLQFRPELLRVSGLELVAHWVAGEVVFEAMPCDSSGRGGLDEANVEALIDSLAELRRPNALHSFLQGCATELRRLTGYQRVMIYRFLPDWSGEVIAESHAAETTERYLGLRFPASDIPPQARELYKINLLRIIADVDAEPAQLLATADAAMLDQSHGLLRCPSPMHIRYLQNMGVRATLVISLLKDGELLGMVACHHNEPKVPPNQLRRSTRNLCALIAEATTQRIDSLRQVEVASRALKLRDVGNRFAERLRQDGDFKKLMETALGEAAEPLQVQGFGLFLHGQWLIKPPLPDEHCEAVKLRAESLIAGDVLCSHRLCELGSGDPDAWAPWGGAMLATLSGEAHSFLLFLRKQVVSQVRWAGQPLKQLMPQSGGALAFGPRTSFDIWTEQIKGENTPWEAEERQCGAELAGLVVSVYQRHSTRQLKQELGLLGSCMAHLNDMVLITEAGTNDSPGPRIVYVNDAFVRTTGYSREEVLGKTPRLLQGPATERAQLDLVRIALSTWQSTCVEVINYRKSGEPYWVEMSLTPIADSSGWFTHWVAIERDISERKRIEQEVQKLVYFDVLTGLPNRRLLMDRLRMAQASSARYKRTGALIFIDLDHFKNLNDSRGHQLGDELLMQVARRLVALVREEDTVARLGGDEFVVMLEELSEDGMEAAAAAQVVSEKIVSTLAEPYSLAGQRYLCSASLGVCLFRDHEQSIEDLLKRADFAMYQSKSAGRNAWRFYDPAMQDAALARASLESDLREAVGRGELELHYQAVVDKQRVPVGVEALLRWRHPTRGWVPPLEFIPLAEQSGLILQIGHWVLTQACRQLAGWATHPTASNWTLAVNISSCQMRQPTFVAEVSRALQESGANPRKLKLELTESLLLHDVEGSISKMRELCKLGVKFSIDDFGTGYSSLTYLQRLPVSVLKIDRSFVKEIHHASGDAAICKTVIALGKTLGLKVVAEGVESDEQFELLSLLGCEFFQGYLFSKPQNIKQIMHSFMPT
jgi:diguanylate cyclase (GGDEF)-like protein/PAS domain S-box-containing protein